MMQYFNMLSEFKGLLWIAIMPGAAAVGYLILVIIEAIRADREAGRPTKKERKKRK